MKRVARLEDMSPDGQLVLQAQEDGDILIQVVPSSETSSFGGYSIGRYDACVEFCTCSCGGGQSPKTLTALRALMQAIKEDNLETPFRRGTLDDEHKNPRLDVRSAVKSKE